MSSKMTSLEKSLVFLLRGLGPSLVLYYVGYLQGIELLNLLRVLRFLTNPFYGPLKFL